MASFIYRLRFSKGKPPSILWDDLGYQQIIMAFCNHLFGTNACLKHGRSAVV